MVAVGSFSTQAFDIEGGTTRKLRFGSAQGATLSPDGTHLGLAAGPGWVVYDLDRETVVARFPAPNSTQDLLRFSPDGRYLLGISGHSPSTGALHVLDLEDPEASHFFPVKPWMDGERPELPPLPSPWVADAVASYARSLAPSPALDGKVRGNEIHSGSGIMFPPPGGALAGSLLATIRSSRALTLVRIEDGESVATVTLAEGGPETFAGSEDGSRLVVFNGEELLLYDLRGVGKSERGFF